MARLTKDQVTVRAISTLARVGVGVQCHTQYISGGTRIHLEDPKTGNYMSPFLNLSEMDAWLDGFNKCVDLLEERGTIPTKPKITL
jgi:hypothetical protein